MKFSITHTTEEKLKSLSERLKYLARITNSARLHIDQRVKSENLQFNLALIISQIILRLNFSARSKKHFIEIVDEFNKSNNTTLTFEDFEKLNWVRTATDEVVLPGMVRHFVWQVGHYEKEGKPIEIPIDKIDLVHCLQLYYQRCCQDPKLTIEKTELENILNEYALKQVTIEFLIEREVIGLDSRSGLYYRVENEYSKQLRNEITSTLWLLVGGEEATINEFKKYFKCIQGTEIWIDDLGSYLSHKNTSKISELAVIFLNSESDLLNSDSEFRKIWLDTNNYPQIDIKTEIPVVEFNYDSTFDFIESVDYHKWRFHDIFDYQETRSFCHSLLRIIVSCEPKHPTSYQNVLKILKDTSRPALLWILYSDIRREFPFVIPYLLINTELVPIAFKLLDKIEIDQVLLSEQSNNDRNFEETWEVKNSFWFEMFDFIVEQLASTPSDDKEKGELLSKILIDLGEKVFRINSSNRNSVIIHNALRKRYVQTLKRLSNKRITVINTYSDPSVSARIIVSLFPYITNYIKRKFKSTKLSHTEFLHLKSGLTDLSIEVLRLISFRILDGEILKEQKEKLESVKAELVSLLQNYFNEFYSQLEIEVQIYSKSKPEKRKAKRGVNEFGFEIIDWGYLFLHFEKNGVLQNIHVNFNASLSFKTESDKYNEQNKEQYEKIKLYLKSLLLAFISINQKKDGYDIEGLPVQFTLSKLEKWIIELSLTYSIEDVPNKKLNVFDEMFSVFGYDMYYQHLTSLLYRSINYFTEKEQNKFVQGFFALSTDIGRMLKAINILDSKELRDIVSQRISEVKIEDYIENSFTTTELQYALIEAVNSTNPEYWKFAKLLIDKIQNHFKQIKINDEWINFFLFEINLLLAFKEKDFKKLVELPVPKNEFQHPRGNGRAENVKQFFIALYKLYNDKNYDDAISILKSLLTDETKSIRYAFHLYRASTLKAINGANQALLNQANQDWENFISNLNDEERKGLSEFTEPIDSNNLYFFATSKDTTRFDQTVNKLSNRYLYDEEIIPTVYNYYIERDLHELAFDYLKKSEQYFIENSKNIPGMIQAMLDNSESVQLLSKYKISLDRIRGLAPTSIPKITPETINDKRQLNIFILGEIIQSLRILKEKIEALRQVKHENRFNDFLQAILRFRFPIWGWSIPDQPRLGTSTGGADAGNADLVIQSGGGTNIALIEAFILRDKDYTQTHILKCPRYIGTINKYYVVVYCLGNSSDFESNWSTYMSDVLSISYPLTFAIDNSIGFIEIATEFTDVVNFKIAKTIHNSNLEVFHVMINLGV